MRLSPLTKDFFREIKRTIPRFLSIFLISMLAVAFFSGIRSGEPDLRFSAHSYMSSHNLMDIRIFSSLLLDDDDIEAIQELDNVDIVEGGYNIDLKAQTETSNNVLHIYSTLPNLNRTDIESGRMPDREDECFLDSNYANSFNYKLGDTINLTTKDGSKSPNLTNTKFIVVGIGSSPEYITFSRGSTAQGTGEANGFAILNSSSFNFDGYTKIDVKLKSKAISFTGEYYDAVKEVEDKINQISEQQCKLRYEKVYTNNINRLNQAKSELDNNKNQQIKKLNDAKNKLDNAKYELNKTKTSLNQSKQEYSQGLLNLKTIKDELTLNWEELNKNEANLNAAIAEYSKGESKLIELKSSYKSVIDEIEDYIKAYLPVPAELLEKEKELKGALDSLTRTLEASKSAIDKTKFELDNAKHALENGNSQIKIKQQQLATAKIKIAEAEKIITDNDIKLNNSNYEYNKNSEALKLALKSKNDEIDSSYKKLEGISYPTWYIQNRTSLPGFDEYAQNADRIKAIGEVFPIIFFLVAILICLTTITRMVDEQRIQIGTLKALGYGGIKISLKFIFYSFIATVTGSIIGALIGGKVIPHIIVSAYRIMYMHMHDVVTPYNYLFGFLAIAIAVFCNLAAAFLASFDKIRKVPANLMRPPVPKSGKKILVERIKFLWERLSFSQKATFRNLSRYKKRFFMTIIGIGGCLSLILVGFGLKDSITAIINLQFGNIQNYDAAVVFDIDASPKEQESLKNNIYSNEGVDKILVAMTKSIKAKNGDKEREQINLVVPDNNQNLKELISLRNRKTKESYNIKDDGCIITEKLAKLLNVREGDFITIKVDDNDVNIKINNITENYLYHYIYMSAQMYNSSFGYNPSFNMYQAKIKEGFNSREIGQNIMKEKAALNVTYIDTLHEEVNNMLVSLTSVILILIISAGLLAFVVLYNLNNINIEERKRELASIKVLGFSDPRLAAYVYRENVYLTILGSVLGVFLGIFLHRYVITTVEVDTCMFGRIISPLSYLYSILLTIAFSVLVNAAMYFKLKKIDMVESLKSFE